MPLSRLPVPLSVPASRISRPIPTIIPKGSGALPIGCLRPLLINGVMSRADTAENTVSIYRQGWDMSTHSEYVSGNTAYGRATFTGPNGESRTVSLTLTCDKNGNIS